MISLDVNNVRLGSGTPLLNTPLATTPLPDRLLIRINYRCVPTYKGSLQLLQTPTHGDDSDEKIVF